MQGGILGPGLPRLTNLLTGRRSLECGLRKTWVSQQHPIYIQVRVLVYIKFCIYQGADLWKTKKMEKNNQ